MIRKWYGCKTLKEYKRNSKFVIRSQCNYGSILHIVMTRYINKNGSPGQ